VGTFTEVSTHDGVDRDLRIPADTRGTTVGSKREYAGFIAKEMSRHG
jgi:hypothetical protein